MLIINFQIKLIIKSDVTMHSMGLTQQLTALTKLL